MTAMANITVKKADGTTDITYTALTPSAGDKVPAAWRENTVSTIASQRPTFNMISSFNGLKDARRVKFWGKYPCLDGLTPASVLGTVPFEGEFLIPLQVPDTQIAEAVHQLTNLMVSTLIRSSVKEGYSPT